MTDSNRTRIIWVDELTLGVTPDTPRMRRARFTSEGLQYVPVVSQPDEIRDDRMNTDPEKVNETNSGPVSGELHFPTDGSYLSSWLRSLMCSEWLNTPARDNDGTGDSVITDVDADSDTFTVVAGAPFVVGHLVRATGFGVAGNNGLFRAESGSDDEALVVASSPGLTDEASVPAAARLKVVGAMGASGDVTALADGIGSTALDFTTLGLRVGQWVKIGGTADATSFAFLVTAGALARRAAWARVAATPTATKLTLDNLPAGWTTDSGTGKTIQFFFGDQIKNGVSVFGGTVERGFMGQTVPTYIKQAGMVAGTATFAFPSDNKATWQFGFTGLSGAQGTVTLDASPDAAPTGRVMSPGVHVGRIAENGTCLSGPNWMQSLQVEVNNNVRPIGGLTCGETVGPVDIRLGSFGVRVQAPTYFGSNALLAKLFAGTPTNINCRIARDNQAVICAVPRIVFTEGSPNAGGKDQDVMLPLVGDASVDEATNAHLIFDRLEYWS